MFARAEAQNYQKIITVASLIARGVHGSISGDSYCTYFSVEGMDGAMEDEVVVEGCDGDAMKVGDAVIGICDIDGNEGLRAIGVGLDVGSPYVKRMGVA